jgi:hypothetical protein
MKAEDRAESHAGVACADTPEWRDDLVRRVASSSTFQKSPRLRAFFLHVCRCALENQPEAATEQQVGIHVFGRPPGYNPNEDNIVRSQARLLRLKLEHHFAHEGRDEPVIITIPKGRYLPVFEQRVEESAELAAPAAAPAASAPVAVHIESKHPWLWLVLTVAGVALAVVIAAVRNGNIRLWSGPSARPSLPSASAPVLQEQPETSRSFGGRAVAVTDAGAIRIAAGNQDGAYLDAWGRRWDTDRYYKGGVAKAAAAPQDLYPPVAEAGLFKTMREAASTDYAVPQSLREFRYDIPVRPGVYELRLYFADPARRTDVATLEDAQNTRHFEVTANGQPLLSGFDPIADAGPAAADIRAFKDITPASDGMVHLAFIPGPERPFLNALELTPGTPGKLRPIRLAARKSGFVDTDGTRWGGDNYFVGGRTMIYPNPETGPKVPALYVGERYGNFSYAIPVPPGSYTVKLHFLESFFSPLIPAAGLCRGVGCRVFDVTCNGVALLRDFDIVKAAPGAFQPVVLSFQGLRPNGQGKLLLSFSPKVNYAEVRAIEVIDEAK